MMSNFHSQDAAKPRRNFFAVRSTSETNMGLPIGGGIDGYKISGRSCRGCLRIQQVVNRNTIPLPVPLHIAEIHRASPQRELRCFANCISLGFLAEDCPDFTLFVFLVDSPRFD